MNEQSISEVERLQGNNAYVRGDWDAAIAHYSVALSARPHDARLHSNRSAAYLAKHRAVRDAGVDLRGLLSLATEDAVSATTYNPRWPDGWFRLFSAHAAAGSQHSAVRALQNGIKHCGANATILAQALDGYAPNARRGQLQAEPRRTTTQLSTAAGDNGSVAMKVSANVSVSSNSQDDAVAESSTFHADHSLLQSSHHRPPRVENVLDHRVVEATNSLSSRPAMVGVTPPTVLGNRPMQREVQQGTSEMSAALLYAGGATTRSGKRISPSEAMRLHANNQFKAGDWDGAIKSYTTSIQLAVEAGVEPDRHTFSNRSAAWLRKAIDTDGAEAFQRALADAEHCVAMDSSWPKAWFRKGSVLMEDGKPGQARQVFLEGLQHCPGSSMLMESLAQSEKVIAEEGEETDSEMEQQSQDTPTDAARHPRFNGVQFQQQARDVPNLGGPASLHGHTPHDTAVEWSRNRTEQNVEARCSDSIASNAPNCNGSRPIMSDSDMRYHANSSVPASNAAPHARTSHAREDGSSAKSHAEDEDAFLRQTLYEVLNVAPDASDAVIRRAYYLAARELHPDKNPDDPHATAKFQRVSEAYQVLSNPQTRATYDKHGESGLEKGAIDAVDPKTLFAIVFGSDQFADFIGELRLTSLAANVDADGNAPSQEVLDKIQHDRVEKLVYRLIEILRPWVDGEKAEFLQWTEHELTRLGETNFGSNLLATLGSVYVHRVDIMRGKNHMFGLSAMFRDATYRTQKLTAQMKANAATNRVMNRQRRLHERVMKLNREGTAISEAEAQGVAAEMAINAVDMMWKISVLDIQSTLETVISRVLSGERITREDELNFEHQRSMGGNASRLSATSDRRQHGEHPERMQVAVIGAQHASQGSWDVRARIGRVLAPPAATTREQIVQERASALRHLGKRMLAISRKQ